MPKTQMLINYVPGEECRIAIVEDGKLEEFYQERASNESHVSNIYKGRVANIEPAIQAAFVDFGLERNGFLHISDLHPKYFSGKDREEFERVGQKTARRDRPPIQKCLKRGDEVLVQVLKEGIGTKGPTLTSYLSIPGRFLVMMPDMQRLGVSRKIEDEDQRKDLRKILGELDPPEKFGFIIRTAGIGQTKTDLKRDLSYLQRLWKNIESKQKKTRKTGELYAESDLVIRTIRDVFSKDIDRIVVDHPQAAKRASDFLSVANPRARSRCVYYDDPIPLFDRYDIETQIEAINSREVPLPSGGSLVLDPTEALVAIDVNSGKSRDARDAESNAYNTNQEAVDEICRQLRLRDLGGVVVNDLIDMSSTKHRKSIEQRFRNNLKKDRARTRIGSISQFGILEMTRQRMRPSLTSSLYNACHHCEGSGYTKSAESVLLSVMRRLAVVMHRTDVVRCELTISPDVAFHLLNRKRHKLVELEQMHHKEVLVRVGGGRIDFVEISAFDKRGGALATDAESNAKHLPDESKASYRDIKDIPDDLLADPSADHDAETPDGDEAPEEAERAEASKAEREPAETNQEDSEESDKPKKRRRRRRGGRGRRRKNSDGDQPSDADADSAKVSGDGDRQNRRSSDARDEDDGSDNHLADESKSDGEEADESDRENKRERTEQSSEAEDNRESTSDSDAAEGGKKRRRRRRGGRRRRKKNQDTRDQSGGDADDTETSSPDDASEEAKPKSATEATEPDDAEPIVESSAPNPSDKAADNQKPDDAQPTEAETAESSGSTRKTKKKTKRKSKSKSSRSKSKASSGSSDNDGKADAEPAGDDSSHADNSDDKAGDKHEPVSTGYSNRMMKPDESEPDS